MDFDPTEIVNFSGHGKKTLLTALWEVMNRAREGRQMAILHRDAGKIPAFVEINHIEEMARTIPAEHLSAANDM
jgi:hypothetical protein